jgi:hypothetical protein
MIVCCCKGVGLLSFPKHYRYHAIRPLSPLERQVVCVGTRMRCCVSATMAGVSVEELGTGDDSAYVGQTEGPGWALLEVLAKLGLHYLD